MYDEESTNCYNKCRELLDAGMYKEAVSSADSISAPSLRAMIFIDGGTALGRSGKVREGVEILEAFLAQDPQKHGVARYSVLYNIANGHSSIYSLRRARRSTVPSNDDNLRAAKAYYREALEDEAVMEPSFASQLLVNYGNCLSQFGRHVEAITCYRRALDMEPANGMAAGNLAQELAYAAEIMGAYRHEYLALAHDLLLHAFGPTMHFNYGSPQAQVDFRYTMKRLQHFMDSHQEKIPLPEPIETIPGSKSRQDYAQFCLTNGLFLNAWAGDDGLSPATADEISFGPIVTTAADRDLIQELLRILNEIKEAFATARYLLFLSQNESDIQNEASEMTYYFSSLDSFVINGLYPGLCKTAYSRAFDVLDKVARIINVYFNVRKREDSFWNVLAEKQSLGKEHRIRYGVRPEIYAFDNYGLYALADLCIDYFESKHIDLRIFDKRRNRITHDYLLVKLYLADEGGQIDHEMSLDDLKTQTIAVLKLVKYAIIYVVSSVNIAERGKETGDHVATIEYQKLQGMRFL